MLLTRMMAYFWALPNTLIGLLVLPLALVRGSSIRRVRGAIEIQGRAVSWLLRRLIPLRGGAAAVTLGHVVLGRNPRTLEVTREHERAHVRQYEQWGPLFLPAYLIAGLVAVLRGGHAYTDNYFERKAREAEARGH